MPRLLIHHVRLATALLTLGWTTSHAALYKVGDIVENFTLRNRATGQPMALSEFEGKIIVLDWFAWWCPFCQAAAPQLLEGIDHWYQSRGGNPAGIPVVHVGVNLQPGQESQTQNFVSRANLDLVLEDFNRAVAGRFANSGQPIFAIINGVAHSPGHPQWQLLYSRLGYGETRSPIEEFRAAIDAVAAPVILPPEPPVPPGLPDVTGECSASIPAAPTAIGINGNPVTGITPDPTSRTTQGSHDVTWTFTDSNGGTATARQRIVVRDSTPPVPPTLPDVVGRFSAAIAAAPIASDSCAVTVQGTTQDPLSRSAPGTTVVTWTFDDGNGNVATAQQRIIVLESPPLTVSSPVLRAEGSVAVVIRFAPGRRVDLQTSNDLLSWNTAATVILAEPMETVTLPVDPTGTRLYVRAVSP